MRYGTIFGFSGINRNVSPFLTVDGEYSESQNFISSKIGGLIKTGDYERKSPQITAGHNVLGGIDFQRADGTHEHIVANDGGANAEIYKYSSSNWVSQSQSLTSGKKVRFCYSPTLDTLFAVNESDSTRSYNGTSWSTITNVTSAPKGKFCISFGRRIYILNATVGATSYPTRAYRSSLVDSGSITWDTTNDWFTFDDGLVGAVKFGNNCLFMCDNSGYVLTLNDEKHKITDKGCVSGDSICSYGGWAFWAGIDGMYGNNGSDTKKISLPIQEYWDGIPLANMSSIQAKIIGDIMVVYIGDITSPETLSNVAFVYDINQNDWNRLTLAHEVKNLHTYVTTSGNKLFAGNDNGEVFEMFKGGSQHGSSFTSFIESNWFYGSGPLNIDEFSEIWGFGEKLSGLKVFYKVGDMEWMPAGELNGSCDFVKLPKGTRGYRLKVRLQETSKENLFEFFRIDVGYDTVYSRSTDTEK
jgi:hypothetical protein